MKNILVPVQECPGQQARLECAIDIVRAVDGYLQCLDVIEPSELGLPVDTGDDGLADSMPGSIKRHEANCRRVVARLEREGLRFSWSEAIGDIVGRLSEAARLNDLVIANSHGAKGTTAACDVAGKLALKCGRPVLGVAHSQRGIDLSAHSVIAWDGSNQAEAALRAAVPLLRLGRSTTILSIGSGSGEETALAVAAYCSRHGISAEIRAERPDNHDVAQQLLAFCESSGARWLVAGAFGHSPMREALFGGTTRELLRSASIPLFLASSS